METLKFQYQNVNFEIVISALEEMEPIAAARVSKRMSDELRPTIASFMSPNIGLDNVFDPSLLSETRHHILHEIAQHCYMQTHASDVSRLKAMLSALSVDFSTKIFTLNYDDLIDRAGNFSDGFTSRHKPTGKIPWAHEVLRFNAQDFSRAQRSGKEFLAHLHGSVRFGYQIECEGIVKFDRAIDALASLYTNRAPSSIDHGNIMTVGPIVSGFNKVAKLAGNPEPYAHYYAAFIEELLGNNRLLVVGYGAMDPYVNTWLKEFVRTHRDRRRLVWITRLPERDMGRERRDIALIEELADVDSLRDLIHHENGCGFQIHKTIALSCSGFPVSDHILHQIVSYLASN